MRLASPQTDDRSAASSTNTSEPHRNPGQDQWPSSGTPQALTGLHALDGARYLRDSQHADATLCRLVAHHSYAIVEAEERGLADFLGLEFTPAPYVLSSVLTCCDMTTNPRYIITMAPSTW
jgi:hypothetical protein